MEISPVLITIMDMAGTRLTVNRNGVAVGEIKGLKNKNPNTNRDYIALFPETDVQAGDLLIEAKSQEQFLITATEAEYVDGEHFQDRAYYDDKGQDIADPEPSPALEEPNQVEADQDNGAPDYLQYLGSLIRMKGGASSSSYEAFLRKVEEIIAEKEIRQGSLADFSELLEENEWLAQALGIVLTSWVCRQ